MTPIRESDHRARTRRPRLTTIRSLAALPPALQGFSSSRGRRDAYAALKKGCSEAFGVCRETSDLRVKAGSSTRESIRSDSSFTKPRTLHIQTFQLGRCISN